jgi:ribosomal protein S27AE/chromosome segregation ATPase
LFLELDARIGSAAMNCPKCGFAQEQRLDCKKCGVVFKKYYALYPSARPPAPDVLEDPIEQGLLERERKTAIADLQLQIRELNARFEEMESEKAERSQLRTELNNLERYLQENLDLTSSRLEEFEKLLGTALGEGLETPEAKAGDAVNQLSPPGEKEDDNSRKISELQDQLSELCEKFRGMQGLLEQLQQNRTAEQPQGMLESDVHAIRANLDQLLSLIHRSSEPRL